MLAEAALQVAGVFHHGVEHAALLGQHRLLLLDGRGVFHEETAVGGQGAVQTGDGLATDVPGHGEPRTMPRRIAALAAVELDRGEAGGEAKLGSRDLVGRDAVVEGLARLCETVGAGEPHRATPVALVRIFVPEVLHDREIGLVSCEGLEAIWQGVVGAWLLDVGEPAFGGDAPAEAEEEEPLRRRGGRGGGGKTAEAKGVEDGQRDHRRAGAEEVATLDDGELHG